jgi:hypothetical protein
MVTVTVAKAAVATHARVVVDLARKALKGNAPLAHLAKAPMPLPVAVIAQVAVLVAKVALAVQVLLVVRAPLVVKVGLAPLVATVNAAPVVANSARVVRSLPL